MQKQHIQSKTTLLQISVRHDNSKQCKNALQWFYLATLIDQWKDGWLHTELIALYNCSVQYNTVHCTHCTHAVALFTIKSPRAQHPLQCTTAVHIKSPSTLSALQTSEYTECTTNSPLHCNSVPLIYIALFITK